MFVAEEAAEPYLTSQLLAVLPPCDHGLTSLQYLGLTPLSVCLSGGYVLERAGPVVLFRGAAGLCDVILLN